VFRNLKPSFFKRILIDYWMISPADRASLEFSNRFQPLKTGIKTPQGKNGSEKMDY
jgi:hypothetical protein